MLKKILCLILLFSTFSISAQVGIGITNPEATLDVVAQNPTGASTNVDGLLIPRVDRRRARFMAGVPTSTIIYVNNLNNAQAGQAANIDAVGFYYFDGSVWQKLNPAVIPNNDWSILGNAGTNPTTNFLGTTDPQDFVVRTSNTERMRVKSTGSVGLNTTDPRGALDVNSSTQGMIPPRVALTSTLLQAPVVNPAGGPLVEGTLVWNTNTAGVIPTNVAPGMYYWDGTRWISLAGSPGGLDWSIIGNGGIDGGTVTTGGTHFLGTYDDTNIDIRTNGIHRARVSNLGEFFIGAYNTVLPGDLMNGVGNATFPWAVNGYTDFDGAGTYGLVTSGNTIYAGVQGEYEGTNSQGPGVRGLTSTTGAGTDYTTNTTSGVNGQLANNNSYSFGVKGETGTNLQIRTGGILGTDLLAAGALGYYASNGVSYALYAMGGTNFGAGGGRMSSSQLDTSIGLGVNGGVVGGWIKGNQYGLVNTGKRFANYNLGKTITNETFIVLDKKQDGTKAVSYATTSMTVDLQDKGMSQLSNGTVYVAFNKEYTQIVDDSKPIIVTVTPFGESNGVHLVSVDKNGFFVKENANGTSNVKFNWIAVAEKINTNEAVSRELLTSNFDKDIDGLMHNENEDGGKAVWSENGEVKFGDQAPINPVKLKNVEDSKPTLRPRDKK